MNAKLGQPDQQGQDPSPPTRRVVAVVELLADRAGSHLTLAEICRELGISRSTGHAILTTLCSCDWVLRDPLSGRYSLGAGLPSTSLPAAPLSRLLREPLRKLCSAMGMAACISELRDGSLAVIESAALARPVRRCKPVCDYRSSRRSAGSSWPGAAAVGDEWMAAAGPVNDVFRARVPKVLKEIQKRGYGIERLSDPLLNVFAALLALEGTTAPDPVAARLAGAVGDLTIIDFLPGELNKIAQHPLATISAPIFDAHGHVVMSVSAQPYEQLTVEEMRDVGARVVEFAEHASSLVAQHAPATQGAPASTQPGKNVTADT